MAENCTIYCKVGNLDKVACLLQEQFPQFEPSSQESMLVNGNAGNLRLASKVFRERGDDFSRLRLSTCVFVERMEGDVSVKALLTSHVLSSELILGVVAQPSFDSDDRYNDIVFAIAKALDGVVFNGDEFLDSNGVTLTTCA